MASADPDLKKRTKDFALRIVRLYCSLPKSTEAQVLGKQILRSGTSVGAQYRESQYAKSDADFLSKVQGSLQELEETIYWLELLDEIQIFPHEKFASIQREAEELRAILITIAKKVKTRIQNPPS
jgi:four helix bundle protein